ncbi:MAG: hypothetical protein AB7S97_03595 [Thermoplasmata archaeon]
MSDEKTGERPRRRTRVSGAGVRRTATTVVFVLAVMAVLDYVSYMWLVPWADEMTKNPTMSLGFMLTILVVFCNFVVSIALVAFVFSEQSYPSEKWE